MSRTKQTRPWEASQPHLRCWQALLADIVPDGKVAAIALRRLIERKDKAQYGMVYPSQDDVKITMRQAEQLLTFAKAVLVR